MFIVHTIETAPEGAKAGLRAAQSAYGRVPNLLGVLAESPGALKAYQAISGALSETALTPAEQQLVFLTISVEHGCEYCVAAHTTATKARRLIDHDTVDRLRAGRVAPDAKLDALRRFTWALVRTRGWVDEKTVSGFLEAGYTRAHVLGVVTALALKTMSNYTNHIAATPVDPAYVKHLRTAAAA